MLRILVFYQDFLQVIFLDNTLSISGEGVSFIKLGYQQVQLACSAHNDGMWIYDQENFSLILLDKNLEIAQQTINLHSFVREGLQPIGIVEYNNRVYLNNPTSGVLIFDNYGTYYETVPGKGCTQFQPLGDWVYMMSPPKDSSEISTITAQNLKTDESKNFEMPISDFKNFRLGLDLLMLQTENSIALYSGLKE
jgi:hypothetical protein